MQRLVTSTTLLFVAIAAVSLFMPATAHINAQEETSQADVVVAPTADASLMEMMLERVHSSWPWYVTRASGLVAGVLFILLMLSGTGFITGHTYRFLEPITAWATHKSLGIALTVAVLIHMISLYFDHFIQFDLIDLLIPFASDYQPVELFGVSFGSLYIALGILAVYLTIAVVATSLIWIDTKPRTWKLVHLLSYLAMIFVFVHALYLGTDLSGGVLRTTWIALGVLVLLASIRRFWRAYTV